MEADSRIHCLDRLSEVHGKLIGTTPTAECIFELCTELSAYQGRSSQRFTNALQTCNVDELDKPENEGSINIGKCCSFSPHDTDDMDRVAQKVTLFPVSGDGNFMQRLRILMEKAHRLRRRPSLTPPAVPSLTSLRPFVGRHEVLRNCHMQT